MSTPRVFCFDIDGTILSLVDHGDYEKALPLPGRVEHLRSLKAEGHLIKLYTARGSQSGQDWRERTEAQILRFAIPCDELILGKPHADLYIDDKSCHPNDYPWQDPNSTGQSSPNFPS